MQTITLKYHEMAFSQKKTYLLAAAFIVGNIAFPQLSHLIPQGGLILLPIYFFTLIGAYKYGWKVGLLTAIFSPILNHLLFGMPPLAALPAILIKSVTLAFVASLAVHYFKRISIPILALVVLLYQLIGTLGEWAFTGSSIFVAIQDFRMAIPGMLLQIFGGYLFIKYLLKR